MFTIIWSDGNGNSQWDRFISKDAVMQKLSELSEAGKITNTIVFVPKGVGQYEEVLGATLYGNGQDL